MATTQATFQELKHEGLDAIDPEIARLLGAELERQRGQIELIASENFTWPAVLEAVGSVPTNKYAEGYPGRRYYGGCEVIDQIEQLAIDRAKELFGAEHANVQPHAGAQTNMAVYAAVMEPGDTLMALALDQGGHLTHGHKVNFSGRLYHVAHYEVSRETMTVDYDDVLARAKEARPKVIVCGGSAYPRTVETDRFRAIADEVGAILVCDMAHFAGLVAAGLQPNPVEHCDFVTSTTHKTLAGPRAGFILCREEHAKALDSAVMPGMQGGPLEHTIAAKATCFRIAMTDAFREYQTQVRRNADTLAETLLEGGLSLDHRRHRHAPPARRPARVGVDGQGGGGAAARDRRHRQPQHGPVRRAVAVRHLRDPARLAGDDDARLRRGRLPRGGADHLRGAHRVARPRRAALPGRGAVREHPLYEGFRGYTTYVA